MALLTPVVKAEPAVAVAVFVVEPLAGKVRVKLAVATVAVDVGRKLVEDRVVM